MVPRLPTPSDFPDSLQIGIVPPSPPSTPLANVLILLHGLGDNHEAFTSLGKNLNLPETVCISVQAPTPLPFDLGGFHWGDDIQFDQASGAMELDTGFERTKRVLGKVVIQQGLLERCGFRRRDIVMFGFGQGGMAALGVTLSLEASEGGELGGVVSIGGTAPTSVKGADRKAKTPVLVLGGSTKTQVTASALSRLRDSFEFLEYKKWAKEGDGMPRNREEMLPIMQFFARRLRSLKGVPEGSVELT
ncbi:MAG: hypothetical protein M4579_002215 [Chaenotheca gracillima]|nr:MAG: hypothetical protein M4579_002215 [Chaenotheca gracillima]